MKRTDIDDKYKWSVYKMYPTIDEFNKDFDYVKEKINEI